MGPFTEQERYSCGLQGFVVRRGVLGADELGEVHQAIDDLAVPTPGVEIALQRFSRFLQHEVFRSLMDHDAVLLPVVELPGPTIRLDHCYGIVMSPGTSGLGLHCGAVPHAPAQSYDVRDGQMFNGLVAVQWALVDHPKGAGGFCCVPGSHKANFALPDPHDPSLVIDVELRAGDVVFFAEALTHGTMPWLGPEQRRSLFFKFAPGFSRGDATTKPNSTIHSYWRC
jgi:Phytanoyl-CoA dioxygenase (PhyH)